MVTINDKSKSDTTEDMLGYVVKEQHSFKGNQLNEALVMINGEVSSTGLKWIDPKRIKSISILKDQPAIAVFGEAGRNGVIVVTADDYQTLINK